MPSGLNSWSSASWLGITSLLVIASTLLFMKFKSLDIGNIHKQAKDYKKKLLWH
jgi:hypothetical protein